MAVIWLTGLSGSGKTTIADKLASHIDSQIVDGDVIRKSISSDLKHGKSDRNEHYRRVVNYIKNNLERTEFTIAAFVSQNKAQRQWIRRQFDEDHIPLYEIYVKTSLQTCEARDPKGLYAKYRKGEDIKLAGLTEEYEEPDLPFLVCDTDREDLDKCTSRILEAVRFKRCESVSKQ